MKEKKSWIDLLDNEEKWFLKWLSLLAFIDIVLCASAYFLGIKLKIDSGIYKSIMMITILLLIFILMLLNAFSSKQCNIKKYPIWFYLLSIVIGVFILFLFIAN